MTSKSSFINVNQFLKLEENLSSIVIMITEKHLEKLAILKVLLAVKICRRSQKIT